MTELTSSATVVRSPELLFSSIDRELVIFEIKQDTYFSLDDIGADIWRRLERPVAVTALCSGLAEHYVAEPSVIERDVLVLLAEMQAAGLVVVSAP